MKNDNQEPIATTKRRAIHPALMPAVRPTAALVLPHFTPEVMHSAVNVIAERLDDGIEDYNEESPLLNTDFRREEVSRIIAEAE